MVSFAKTALTAVTVATSQRNERHEILSKADVALLALKEHALRLSVPFLMSSGYHSVLNNLLVKD